MKRQKIRVMATFNSFTPIIETDSLSLDVEKIKGIKAVIIKKPLLGIALL